MIEYSASQPCYSETDFFALKYNTLLSGEIIGDLCRRQPSTQGCTAELITVLSPMLAASATSHLVLCSPKEHYLFRDLQTLGLQFCGVLIRKTEEEELDPSIPPHVLWECDFSATLTLETVKEWMAGEIDSRSIVRFVLRFCNEISHDASAAWQTHLEYSQSRERYFLGLTEISMQNNSYEELTLDKILHQNPQWMPSRSDTPILRKTNAFDQICVARRSAEDFDNTQPLTASELNTLFQDSFYKSEDGHHRFACAGGIGKYSFFSVTGEGEVANTYYCSPSTRTLYDTQLSNLKPKLFSATLQQSILRNVPTWLILVADARTIMQKYGARGYRFLFLDSGGIIEQLHLAAMSYGFRFRTVGGYDDVLMSSLLALPMHFVVTSVCAMGKPTQS